MPEPELLTTELCGLGVPGILSGAEEVQKRATTKICLLYTSDAADDWLVV